MNFTYVRAVLMGGIQTPDIAAEQLNTATDMLLKEFGEISAEHLLQGAVVNYVKQRRSELVLRQDSCANQLRGTELEIVPHISDIIFRGPVGFCDEALERQDWPPIKAYEAITLAVLKKGLDGVCDPRSREPRMFYSRFTGYSLTGYLKDKREGKGYEHHVSLVGRNGEPQITIIPA